MRVLLRRKITQIFIEHRFHIYLHVCHQHLIPRDVTSSLGFLSLSFYHSLQTFFIQYIHLRYAYLNSYQLLPMLKLTIEMLFQNIRRGNTVPDPLCPSTPILLPHLYPVSSWFLPNKSMLSRTRMRPIQMRVQHSTYTAFHGLDRLRQ